MELKRVAVFSSKPYDKLFLDAANSAGGLQLEYFENRLRQSTMKLTEGFDAVSCFVNDIVDRPVLEQLVANGIRMIALRCAGFNNVDLDAARELGVQVARVPGYSPESVAEHTVAMMLSLNRKLTKAYNRVKEHNFDLDGLLGFNLQKSTVGIIGTGKIGLATMRALSGFGCKILCYDPYPSEQAAALGEYCDLDRIYRESDVISLHCPLTEESYHLVNENSIAQMKDGVMLINTSRGALVNAQHALDGMKQGKIGYLGLDVYELEGDIFFRDLSGKVLHDDVFALLLSYPNVLVTGHQGYFTKEALEEIGQTTIANLQAHFDGRTTGNEL
ncbi:2-hydroxyacid dehydrogenase [Ferrimonas balearica]|uniref:2-hydroxyacid dehydrogenase n=1 Tax=Ferrimonas balearica TaxID=44012 RepID=UPI001F157812|nr:2-hydroxyacid dehydrogenase [Ferrimonas balearica]MBY6095189.1 2-hydroxyacid dehydrogenase [Ferrimonas balearica]